jgi:serine/threonine protein kinase
MHDLTVYTEVRPLGSGGFADVVAALNIVTKEVVALKKSRPVADCIARTTREIGVQRLMLHGNIMPVLDWAEDGSWFVMPHAGGDVAAIHEREPVKGAGLLRLVEDVGAALAAAHRRGFVHRDLTPSNILWLRDRWVVADWGFVKLPPEGPRMKLTRTGVGTEGFTAPEVYRDGNAATPACDIYSLGRIVGWLLIGRPIEPGKPVPLEADSCWERFVSHTTSEDPAERPQTIGDAMKLLEPVLADLAEAVPGLPTSPILGIDVHKVTSDAFKVLLQDPTRQIQLCELLDRETEAAFDRLTPEAFSVQIFEEGVPLAARLRRYADSVRLLMELLIIGCAYGAATQAALWTGAIRRIGHPSGEWGGNTAMLKLRYFPTTLLVYAGALAALAREQWVNFSAVTRSPLLTPTDNNHEVPAILRVAAASVMGRDLARTLPGMDGRHTPTSDWLFELLRDPLRPLLRIDMDYEQAFDRMEYLIAMMVTAHRDGGWFPTGRFCWRDADRRHFKQRTLGDALRSEVENLGAEWGPVRAGMFRDAGDALKAIEGIEKDLGGRRWL